MTVMESLLNSRASFELAAFAVTWIAITLLVVVVINLNTRVLRLERERGSSPPAQPYGHLLGKRIEDVVDVAGGDGHARLLVFLSSRCGSCRRVLNELTSPTWKVPTAVLWTDEPPATAPRPDKAIVVEDGARISADLGIRVTPFGVVADESGRIVQATPINSLRSLGLNGYGHAGPAKRQLSQWGERNHEYRHR
jgi:hypothetical protein